MATTVMFRYFRRVPPYGAFASAFTRFSLSDARRSVLRALPAKWSLGGLHISAVAESKLRYFSMVHYTTKIAGLCLILGQRYRLVAE